MPTISIVTICYNNLDDVIKTCKSVDEQTLHPTEHWIINGSTNNEIADWLQSTPQPDYRKWINENDNGIADAFNKGILKSNGTITHLLNSGDSYITNDILKAVEQVFANNISIEWISGKIKIKRAGHWIEIGKPFDESQLYKGMRSVSHPTWFVKREVYNTIGLFNEKYKIGMDYDLMCRLKDEPYLFVDKTMVLFDDSGISNTSYLQSLKENVEIYESHFGHSLKCRLWQLRLKTLFLLLQTKFGKWLFAIKAKAGLENA
jgi:GT2 family glycosyltransferase